MSRDVFFCECGFEATLFVQNTYFGPSYWIECKNCCRSGQSSGVESEAISRWNQEIWVLFGDTAPAGPVMYDVILYRRGTR